MRGLTERMRMRKEDEVRQRALAEKEPQPKVVIDRQPPVPERESSSRQATEFETAMDEESIQYEMLPDKEVRGEILRRIDRLIDEVRERCADVLVFLDRSARPLAWVFRDRFRIRFPEEKPPQVKFINVQSDHNEYVIRNLDRASETSSWATVDDVLPFRTGLEDHTADFTTLSGVTLDNMRSRFKSSLDGKRILVIDEMTLTGSALGKAMRYLSHVVNRGQIFGKPFFYQERSSLEATPWIHEKGSSGVMETPFESGFSVRMDEDAARALRMLHGEYSDHYYAIDRSIGELKSVSKAPRRELRAPAYENIPVPASRISEKRAA